MDIKQIEKLMASMGRTGLKKLVIKKEGFELELEREISDRGASMPVGPEYWLESDAQSARDYQTLRRNPHELPSSHPKPPIPVALEEEAPGTYITSPMVGTFYSAPSPEEASYVKVGDKVDKNTVVCIIEAMKVMNEIKAGREGVVAEILVEASSPVEFGTKLFRIV